MLKNKNLDKIVAQVFNCRVEDLSKYKIEGTDAYYYCDAHSRGGQGVFAENGEMLIMSTATIPDKLIEEFKNGKRTI